MPRITQIEKLRALIRNPIFYDDWRFLKEGHGPLKPQFHKENFNTKKDAKAFMKRYSIQGEVKKVNKIFKIQLSLGLLYEMFPVDEREALDMQARMEISQRRNLINQRFKAAGFSVIDLQFLSEELLAHDYDLPFGAVKCIPFFERSKKTGIEGITFLRNDKELVLRIDITKDSTKRIVEDVKEYVQSFQDTLEPDNKPKPRQYNKKHQADHWKVYDAVQKGEKLYQIAKRMSGRQGGKNYDSELNKMDDAVRKALKRALDIIESAPYPPKDL